MTLAGLTILSVYVGVVSFWYYLHWRQHGHTMYLSAACAIDSKLRYARPEPDYDDDGFARAMYMSMHNDA